MKIFASVIPSPCFSGVLLPPVSWIIRQGKRTKIAPDLKARQSCVTTHNVDISDSCTRASFYWLQPPEFFSFLLLFSCANKSYCILNSTLKKKQKRNEICQVVVKCSHRENGLFNKKSVRGYSHSFKV